MKIKTLLEASYNVVTINQQDLNMMQKACDLINEGAQLSWTLNPQRLSDKLGGNGMMFGLESNSGDMVGVIGLKSLSVMNINGVEIGYLYVTPEHRSLRNATLLYNIAISKSSMYPFIMASTNVNNTAVNSLLNKTSKMKYLFKAKSPYSSNILNYWVSVSNNGVVNNEQIEKILKEKFSNESLNESISFNNIENAPSSFQHLIKKIPDMMDGVTIDSNNDDDVKIIFGKSNSLPSKKNTIYVGNKFYPKDTQYNILQNIVPTIKTFSSSDAVNGKFIAKKKIGQKQDGQTIDKVPENPDDFIYQPFVEIISEYRVIVYFMNGRYHVSGIYKKVGSNMSFQSITSGNIAEILKRTAIDATENLEYGLSGVDLALVNFDENINESSIGYLSSISGKMIGRFSRQKLNDDEIIVVLECNTMPSMNNPMILHDLIKSINSNKAA